VHTVAVQASPSSQATDAGPVVRGTAADSSAMATIRHRIATSRGVNGNSPNGAH
jgi:hypothetical protein